MSEASHGDLYMSYLWRAGKKTAHKPPPFLEILRFPEMHSMVL